MRMQQVHPDYARVPLVCSRAVLHEGPIEWPEWVGGWCRLSQEVPVSDWRAGFHGNQLIVGAAET